MKLTFLICFAILCACQVPKNLVFPAEWQGPILKKPFKEPSGIVFHQGRGTLFLIGDEGHIAEITKNGEFINSKLIKAGLDFEGITTVPKSGLLYAVIEGAEVVVEIDPDSFQMLRRFKVERNLNSKTIMEAGNQGVEAITFIPDNKHEEGGYFLLANQAFKDLPSDLSAIVRVDLPLSSSGGGQGKVVRYFEPGVIDLSGLHYDQKTQNLWVVSDATNTIHFYSLEGKWLRSYAFPGDEQEGITVDDDGFLYIAQDTGGILKYRLSDALFD